MKGKTIAVFLSCLLVAGIVQIKGQEQHPILDQAANKVIQKYQNASCQQLWAERQQGNSVSAQRSADACAVH